MSRKRLAEQSRDKRLGIEVLEVIDVLAHTDEAQGKLQLFGNRDDDTRRVQSHPSFVRTRPVTPTAS